MSEQVERQIALWINHNEARVFHVDRERFDESTIRAPRHHVHRHPKRSEDDGNHNRQDDATFFRDVLATLDGAAQILVLGPSVTKMRFLRYAETHAPTIAHQIIGMESAEDLSDRQLVAHVRHYFHTERPRLGLVT